MRQSAQRGMPTSLSVPVVAPARRCARNPRSGPLQRSSASPIAATGATDGTTRPTTPPTSGSRRPAEAPPLRDAGREDVAELASAVEEAARVPAGGAVPEVELDLPDVEAGLQRVDRHPCLDAEPGRDGEQRLARCGGQRPLAREGLPQAAAAPKPDQPARSPLRHAEPAADSRGEGGDRDVRGGRSEGTEVAVEVGVAEEQRPGGALPLGERQRLSPFPRRGSRMTLAPASAARAAVRSREPSSATTISASGKRLLSAATVCRSVPPRRARRRGPSSVPSLLGRSRHERAVREDAVGRAVVDPVAAGARPGEEERESDLTRGRVDPVHRRKAPAVECRDRAPGRLALLDADGGYRGCREPAVEAGEERLVSPCCGDAGRATTTASSGTVDEPDCSSTTTRATWSKTGFGRR